MGEVPDCIREKVAEYQRDIDRTLTLVDPVRDAEAVIAEVGCGHRFGTFVAVPNTGHATLYLSVNDMREVLPVLRALRQRGYKVAEYDDRPEQRTRNYDLGRIHVYATLPAIEGAACRFEVVGKREVPVYELRCDGAAVEAES